jgi:flagellar biosynthesis anti-sigma factor FlgM
MRQEQGLFFGDGRVFKAGLDQNSFSLDQMRVHSLETEVLVQPEVRGAKVRTLQQSIGNGEYSVSANKVADALINELSRARVLED